MSQVLLVGSPNSGKSLLFNKLTGLNQKVANFPGITVGTHSGHCRHYPELELVDFPGVYSMHAISGEESIALDALSHALNEGDVSSVLCVVDSTRLEKGLVFALQLQELCGRYGKRLLIAANMQDVLHKHDLDFDAAGLEKAINMPVVPLSAKTGEGLETLEKVLATTPGDITAPAVASDIIGRDENAYRGEAEQLARDFGPKGDLLLKTHSRADAFFLSSFTGGVSFLLIMYFLFQSIFTWAAPVMDAVENSLLWLSSLVLPHISNSIAFDFIDEAIFGGLGAFLVFVPQIFVLTLMVGMLEDSGYLSRAAVICHRPLRAFGLTGKSFIPMLSGVACAIPGIYAARTIESPRRRWLTYLAIPLMPCSARLPVYALLISAFIPAESVLGGWVGLQGLAMFGVYLLGIMAGLLVTALVSRTIDDHGEDAPFVLEMPPYRMPSWLPLLRGAWERSKHFVTKAGPVIFWVTMVVWFLGYFPNFGADLGESWLGVLGHIIEPVFAPIGLDWKYGVAIIASFLAREVFVGTLGTLFGIEGAQDNVISLSERVQASGLSVESGFALLVFFAIAAQCVSTLAVLARETGSWKLPIQMFIGYGLFAYASALGMYHLVGALS
ncbi:MAG: ferrous iron transporter B [Proteobacteria bacterium]|nr:ferrous iron transporter B [Pseudomonadota bacterium]